MKKEIVNDVMVVDEVRSGFIEHEVMADEWALGGVDVLGRAVELGAVVNESGNWLSWLPVMEEQNRWGFETMSCATFGTLNAYEILLRYKGYEEVNYSDRFTSLLAGTTPRGNSPHKVADIARRKGLLSETRLPFSQEVATWEKYYSGIDAEMLAEAQTFVKRWDLSHSWVWTGSVDVGRQRELLATALKRSPVGVAVFGWAATEQVDKSTGEVERVYLRPAGVGVNHWCLLVDIEVDGTYVVLDSYEPFIKKLDKNYVFELPKVYGLGRKEGVDTSSRWYNKALKWVFMWCNAVFRR